MRTSKLNDVNVWKFLLFVIFQESLHFSSSWKLYHLKRTRFKLIRSPVPHNTQQTSLLRFLWNIYHHLSIFWSCSNFFSSILPSEGRNENKSTKAMNEKWRIPLYYVFALIVLSSVLNNKCVPSVKVCSHEIFVFIFARFFKKKVKTSKF